MNKPADYQAIRNIRSKIDPDAGLLMITKFGSHLYGTDTPASDTDYKGIFMPSPRMIALGKVPKSYNMTPKKAEGVKNTADDVDCELYSLHYFLELALKGETVALDMLHSNSDCLIHTSGIWEQVQRQRKKFYTKNLKAFVGYARRQAAKYGIKGSRLNAAKEFLEYIMSKGRDPVTMKEIWDDLPIGEHIRPIETNPNGVRQVMVCGKIIQETVSLNYAYVMIDKFYRAYGDRAQQAADNKGIDWKAISHALRAGYQVKSLLIDKDLSFPLPEADYLRDVKNGEFDYMTEVAPVLEELMSELEILTEQSDLPDKPDRGYWEAWLFEIVHRYLSSTPVNYSRTKMTQDPKA